MSGACCDVENEPLGVARLAVQFAALEPVVWTPFPDLGEYGVTGFKQLSAQSLVLGHET
jgi:hypothetical protein